MIWLVILLLVLLVLMWFLNHYLKNSIIQLACAGHELHLSKIELVDSVADYMESKGDYDQAAALRAVNDQTRASEDEAWSAFAKTMGVDKQRNDSVG